MHAEKRGIGKWYPCIFLIVGVDQAISGNQIVLGTVLVSCTLSLLQESSFVCVPGDILSSPVLPVNQGVHLF